MEVELTTVFETYSAAVGAALDALEAAGTLPAGLERRAITLEPPRDMAHGDLSTNAAMVLAKPAKMNPRAIADSLSAELRKAEGVASVEVAGPGFINIRLDAAVWIAELGEILKCGDDYGRFAPAKPAHVNVEYVSANPTGPMHMGHCRGAVVGDALAALLEYAGNKVTREYYVNDAGGQVDVLARSAHLRYREALGQDIGEIPEGLYPGDYLKPVGAALAAEFGETYANADESDWLPIFRKQAVAAMLQLIKEDLALLGIRHDVFASEAEVQAAGAADAAEADLRAAGYIYEGVLEPPKGELPDDWEPVELTLFRSTAFGDDVDRPIKKSDGSWTYFGADIAYHRQKAASADQLINIWGADHAGTVKRIQAAVAALTDGKPFDVKLVQMVRLFRAGEPVKMSKRSGSFVTLADVVREVGKDVVRFMMLTRRADAPLDFDFAKVVEQSKDNPVFYVQYAHARICSLARRAVEAGIEIVDPAPGDLARLDAAELDLVKLAAQWPRIVEAAAVAHEPHRIAFYLGDLAAAFHANWNRGNDDPSKRYLLADDHGITNARLALARGVGQIIASGLRVMGVTPVEEMN